MDYLSILLNVKLLRKLSNSKFNWFLTTQLIFKVNQVSNRNLWYNQLAILEVSEEQEKEKATPVIG